MVKQGNKLFGVDIASEIYAAMKDQLLPATLIIRTPGTRTGNLTGGTNPTEASYTCEGFIDSQNRRSVNGTLVEDGNIIVVIIGDSLEAAVDPKTEDKVTIEGSTYWIRAIDRDPAKATYTLLCKNT